MSYLDLSGTILPGIWKYGDMYPDFFLRHIQAEPTRFFCEAFDGFHSQTGTYLETTAHVNGYEGQRLIEDVELSSLMEIHCRVLHLDAGKVRAQQQLIQPDDLIQAMGDAPFRPGCALLLECGWSDWASPAFLTGGPNLSRAAMELLLAQKPFLLGSDTPAWEGPEPVFDLFAKTDTLLLAPLVGLESAPATDCSLTVLPLKVAGTCCVPARAVLRV